MKFLDKLVDSGAGDASSTCSDAGNLGDVCSAGQGACERAGTYECTGGMVTCSAVPGTPSVELCDTKRDEDCDGKIDEAPESGCCADADCAKLQVCERPSGDTFAGGSCKAAGDPHADCKYDHDKIVCTCQKGYEGDGKTCERNACVPLGSDPAPCGAHQTCTPTAPGKNTCACAAGFADCDGKAANGCEVTLATDAKHCGACDLACGTGISCSAGSCVPHVTQMSLGYWGSLAVTPDAKVLGWGGPAILYGNTDYVLTPALLNVGKAKQVTQGEGHACIIADGGGSVICWGKNTYNQLGVADTKLDYAQLSIAVATSIAAGQYDTCVVAGAGGNVFCWGESVNGILGVSASAPAPYDATAPIAGVTNAVDVELAANFACALTTTGRVYCWGNEGNTKYAPELVRDLSGGQPALDDAVTLRTGIEHACALRKDKTLVCWGGNSSGQLGNGTQAAVPRNRFVKVDVNGEALASFTCGGGHTCAITASHALYCWGANNNGALGTQTASYQPSAWPLKNSTLQDVVAVYSGFGAAHTCASTRDGRLYCWGYNYHCQLGLGSTTCPSGGPVVMPTEVTEWP